MDDRYRRVRQHLVQRPIGPQAKRPPPLGPPRGAGAKDTRDRNTQPAQRAKVDRTDEPGADDGG